MQKFLSNLNKNYFFVLLIFVQIFIINPIVVFADLPNGNAVKDPNAILRNSLPIKQIELQDIQLRRWILMILRSKAVFSGNLAHF